MAYTAFPDMRMPWDIDGTILAYNANNGYGSVTICLNQGATTFLADGDATMVELNDHDGVGIWYVGPPSTTEYQRGMWWYFPEQREVTGWCTTIESSVGNSAGLNTLQGSNDTANGVDGTWETASWPSGIAAQQPARLDAWRIGIKPVSFTGGKRVLRGGFVGPYANAANIAALHIYGEKVAGQTPDDVVFINHDDTPNVEFAAPEDFGDQPLGTTVVRQFRLKNTSATKTANTINIQCNDSLFAISEDNSVWVATINIASLSAGAQSATLYVRCTTPNPQAALGPYGNRIVVTVGSYT